MINEGLSKEFHEAMWFAYDKHSGQLRKYGNEPYINHPIRVALDVQRHGGAYEQIVAALLHDVLEDTDTTYSEVYDKFGEKVADIVNDLTDKFTPEAFPTVNRAERKVFEAERLKTIRPESKLVKVCDIIDNSKSVVAGILEEPAFVMMYLREKIVVLEALGFK